ncbi:MULTISPECIES: flagellar M-ring protein FliF [unclassified Desulfovibrio]|uniref:flagellar M-ring protein FliF n=1 Tax=unclassified Desulfovibrio TaxID=2593640 RepID=UPI002FD946CE
MKQLKPSPPRAGLSAGQGGGLTPALAQLKALRLAQRETNQRVEELKLRLVRITEQHMDQAVRLIKRWLSDKD